MGVSDKSLHDFRTIAWELKALENEAHKPNPSRSYFIVHTKILLETFDTLYQNLLKNGSIVFNNKEVKK